MGTNNVKGVTYAEFKSDLNIGTISQSSGKPIFELFVLNREQKH